VPVERPTLAKKTHTEIFHSEPEPGSVLFVLFMPSKTKDGDDLPAGQDQELWASNVGDVLTEAFNGATQMPVAKGKWLNDNGKIISEAIVLLHSYASDKDAENEGKLQNIAKILHRMGHVTKQGEVGLVIDGIFHRIRRFPLAQEEVSK
jgi:hypothetical protein